jgi:two-component system response regulator YesN
VDSSSICNKLADSIAENFNLTVKAGIGSIQSIHSLYTSFLDALACMHYNKPDQITYYMDIEQLSLHNSFDYLDTEKHLIEAIRLRKPEAYDYFGIIMEWIRPLNDEVKRNKILEIIVLANHAMQMDSLTDAKSINYTLYVSQFMDLKGNELIEFAFQCFIYITSYVKPQTTIDYTNHIVKATREYLESHYTDDISLEDMASQVNISPQYFSKLIKKTTGFNFIDWLSMLRVKKAKELLTDSSLTVKEVCFMITMPYKNRTHMKTLNRDHILSLLGDGNYIVHKNIEAKVYVTDRSTNQVIGAVRYDTYLKLLSRGFIVKIHENPFKEVYRLRRSENGNY